jgi:hypothetical protein
LLQLAFLQTRELSKLTYRPTICTCHFSFHSSA